MKHFLSDFLSPHRQTRAVPLGRLTITVQIVGALLFFAFTASKIGVGLPFTSSSYALELHLTDAAGLDEADHPPVLVAGVKSGRVTEVRREGRGAVARLELDDATRGKIFSDATAELFPRSGIQDLNVDLDPGTPGHPALRDGARIIAGDEALPVNLDRVTKVLDADTRAYVQIMLGELAVALKDRPGELREALERLGSLTDSSRRVASALADRRELLAQLVTQLDIVFNAVGRRGGELARAIDMGKRTLAVTGRRDTELAASVRLLPGVLRDTDAALTEVARLSEPLVGALDRLRAPIGALPAGMRALRRLVPAGHGLLDDLGPLTRSGRRPAAQLRDLLEQLGPLARESRSGIGRTDALLAPLSEQASLEAIPRFIEGEAGAQSLTDANGVVGRGMVVAEEEPRPENFGLPAGTPRNSRAMERVRADLLAALRVACARVNKLACGREYGVPSLRRLAQATDARRSRRGR